MNVFRADDQYDDHHAFGFLCPFFSDQETINKRWDGDPNHARSIYEQLICFLISAICDGLRNEFNCFDERELAGEKKPTYAVSDFYTLLCWHSWAR